MSPVSSPRLWTFVGGDEGAFTIVSSEAVRGAPVPTAARLNVTCGEAPVHAGAFAFQGVVSNARYTTHRELGMLTDKQQALGRPAHVGGAMVLLRKSQSWWDLAQDARRAIFEERSKHVELGQQALPQVARRLHHCRDLGTEQPFDFITWFDFLPGDAEVFDTLLAALRSSEEWEYVEREVDIRVVRDPG